MFSDALVERYNSVPGNKEVNVSTMRAVSPVLVLKG